MLTKYIVWALFIVLWSFEAWAQEGRKPGPGGMASDAVALFACTVSPVFGFLVMSVPVAFTVYYLANYLNVQEKNKRQGKGGFYSDDLLLLMASSIMVAALLRLLYVFWNEVGIPVKSIISLYLFCNESGNLENECTKIFPDAVIPKVCQAKGLVNVGYFRSAIFFLVGFGSFVSKLFLVMFPITVFLVLLGKNLFGAYQMVKERQTSALGATMMTVVDALVLYFVLLFYVSVIYDLLHVPWDSLTDWFVEVFLRLNKGGSS